MRYVFGGTLGDPLADEIGALLSRYPEGLRRTDINKHFGGHEKGVQIQRALQMLAEQGRVRRVEEGTPGRPAERWLPMGRPAEIADYAEEG